MLTVELAGSGRLRAANHGGGKARVAHRHFSAENHLTEIIDFFGLNMSSACSDETILLNDETIFRFRADIRKQPLVISYPSTADNASALTRRQPMRTISFILGFAVVLAGPSIAGFSDGSLPGIGTFSYNSSSALTVVAGN